MKVQSSIVDSPIINQPIVDCHTHSHFSFDSKMSMQDGIAQAQAVGLGGITFTDHIEFAYSEDDGGVDKLFDNKKRLQELQTLQKQYPDFQVLSGLEIGFQPNIMEEVEHFIAQYPVDCIINSVHRIDGIRLSPSTFYEQSKEQAYTRYLLKIEESITEFNNFDIVGHIGYICRYATYADKALRYAEFSELLDRILKHIIAKGKALEINTAGLSLNLGFTHPEYGILKRYKELGGTLITLGSDAHRAARVGDHFNMVIPELIKLGFTQVCYVKNRTFIMVPLPVPVTRARTV
jgi:histidinol-phosphatase (PHP family)